MIRRIRSFRYYKWMNLIGFALFYNTVYIGRFNLNSVLTEVSEELKLISYQETLLYSSVFIAYAAGSMINGRIVDRQSGRLMILLGAGASILANVLVAFSKTWQIILLLSLINGYFQSMIWVSGISLLAKWWSSKERGLGGGIANFFSGLSHATAYLIPAGIAIMYPQFGWRINFIIPMGAMAVFLGFFCWIVKDRPEELKLEPFIEDDRFVAEVETYLYHEIYEKKRNPWKYFFRKKNFLWWCSIAMLSSLCRYGLLKWIPLYYAREEGGSILSQSFSNLILPLGMAFGTLILTWITGRRFQNNKGLIIIISAALCGTLVVIFPTMISTQVVLFGIFSTGFFLYGINGILWLYAMDEGGRIYSGTTAGILNCFAYIGAAAEAFLFPMIVDVTGEMISIFIVMEVFCIAMVICGIVVSEKDTAIEPELE
ncbi:MFS transporter [Sinanaerobacter chloroacetimidivorans]|uniref:MFS transporter n=1 Tax=Sinanaerobacter chloroacetimidivorans TaxID=2818044 RepID=A0A8J7W222_9FIRM|nr:MFS transporter [Sinanaerobacter chloroacetimidivorans]MBR0598984.1 MFS transporter [Sinanaerobacter chloroacetimidivorans]